MWTRFMDMHSGGWCKIDIAGIDKYTKRKDVLIISASEIAGKDDNSGAPGTFGYFSMRD